MTDTPALVTRQADAELEVADRLFEVAAVAKRLKKCPETIRRYIRAGQLPAVRAPGHRRAGNYLVAESALVAFLIAHPLNILRQPTS